MKKRKEIDAELREQVINFVINNPGVKVGDVKKAYPQFESRQVDFAIKQAYAKGIISRRSNNNLHFYYGPEEVDKQIYVGHEKADKFAALRNKAMELEGRGMWRRAGLVWLDAFSAAPDERERAHCANRRRYCLHSCRNNCESRDSGAGGAFSGDLPRWA